MIISLLLDIVGVFMINRIKKYLEDLNAEKEMKKKYLEDEKRYYFENTSCMNCKFLCELYHLNGTLGGFECKITGKSTFIRDNFPEECEYFASARIHGKGNENEL